MPVFPLSEQIADSLHPASIMLSVQKLFLIPVGGGIPAGVLLAHSKGLAWPITAGLYLVSDVVLAIAFEPILRLISAVVRKITNRITI